MKEVYDIKLVCSDPSVSMREVTTRMIGLNRSTAIEHVKTLFPAYRVLYVIKMQSVEE